MVRKVLLDAFGTIFSPTRPVPVQYSEVAKTYGINVHPDIIAPAFKSSYKTWAKARPLYGKLSGLTASEWWAGLIGDTLEASGVSKADFEPVRHELTTTLIERFWSREGYSLHSDVMPFLTSLYQLSRDQSHLGLSAYPGVVSGSDLGFVKVLKSLGVTTPSPGPGVLLDEIWTTWELEHDKTTPEFWREVLSRLNESAQARGDATVLQPSDILVIGDELTSDYQAPRSVGMRSVLLQRDSKAEHANTGYDRGSLQGVEIIQSLCQVPDLLLRDLQR